MDVNRVGDLNGNRLTIMGEMNGKGRNRRSIRAEWSEMLDLLRTKQKALSARNTSLARAGRHEPSNHMRGKPEACEEWDGSEWKIFQDRAPKSRPSGKME